MTKIIKAVTMSEVKRHIQNSKDGQQVIDLMQLTIDLQGAIIINVSVGQG